MKNSKQSFQFHNTLITSNSTKLGEILWLLLNASHNIKQLTEPKTPKNENGFAALSKVEATEFQKEFSGDEIHWWVFKKEVNLDELKQYTELTCDAVQRLKEAAVNLRSRYKIRSYDELLSILNEYVESYSNEIDTLHKYVKWLYQRDPLTPSILFTYRVWGSTRRMERWWSGKLASNFDNENAEAIQKLIEIVFGLYKSGSYNLYTWESVYREIEMELAQNNSQLEGDRQLDPPVLDVLFRTAYETLSEFAIFFEFIRNSLNNILVDIDKQRNQTSIIKSDNFWRAFTLKALASGKSEQQLWDFKKTLDMWHIKIDKEKSKAEISFAEDVASFANAQGGVLIIGVSNLPVKITGIGEQVEIEHKLKYTRQVISERINYRRDIFHFQEVAIDDGNGNLMHCLVIVIAQAQNVVEVKGEAGRYSYPVRLETGLERVARDEIAIAKLHVKSDNFDFVQELEQFLKE
jgi:hypothetical protein